MRMVETPPLDSERILESVMLQVEGATMKLRVASRMMGRLTMTVSVLLAKNSTLHKELATAQARIAELEKREQAFRRELIQEMTLTAELTERIENDVIENGK